MFSSQNGALHISFNAKSKYMRLGLHTGLGSLHSLQLFPNSSYAFQGSMMVVYHHAISIHKHISLSCYWMGHVSVGHNSFKAYGQQKPVGSPFPFLNHIDVDILFSLSSRWQHAKFVAYYILSLSFS
ncbi:hypothetical protein FNV43_RR07287 [Rhamnella rubrinervis]|uniref:Uncharacterized protein n=1 Tax=Rhamnella rubrinervis TaxID=2594499 RepID=A0A8K0HFG0_9ROSA|nr:hypothetical protein FNV43_RR07287 [Rhamnella rubrinervis]